MSGGPDSLAMLLLFHKVAPRDFQVATVDHGLRAESAGEAAMVAAICAGRGIAHQTLTLSLEKGSAVQERARAARYRALAEWAQAEQLAAIVTAHHADDQAETMVMRLNRGVGLRGLAAMRPVAQVPGAPRLRLLRPLLSWRRAELQAVVDVAGLAAADDPSNRDPGYERVRMRDALTSNEAFAIMGFARSARNLADADAALEWVVDQLWEGVVAVGEGFTWNPPPGLPDVLAMRLLERVLAALGAGAPRGAELVRWLGMLREGGVATLGGVKGDARANAWRFTLAPPHASRS
ncbi:tRNA lysidine(34) synthetase TilS [Novosphingobium subterraneum]|uniref:tRNA lysidine(34) synthetase TilS n=1 Tax=Novosphingobium subterraneum TaxID=48936 RepID=UPI003CFC7B8A